MKEFRNLLVFVASIGVWIAIAAVASMAVSLALRKPTTEAIGSVPATLLYIAIACAATYGARKFHKRMRVVDEHDKVTLAAKDRAESVRAAIMSGKLSADDVDRLVSDKAAR
ncbi:hypothetical protein NT6N_35740 [Oceaniferula spumae]|uniref:Uncharacterized protein n=1 Tax=Oceaniferula spumae TaxID=2979115 RepID=A0AAT9FRL3_9BACT